ncbi:MAG: hypothetical protein IPN17_13235 [Deltaproteobacteria bacterium]|nr:hypothetical protein [Deltaproteobacteria bacterium]
MVANAPSGWSGYAWAWVDGFFESAVHPVASNDGTAQRPAEQGIAAPVELTAHAYSSRGGRISVSPGERIGLYRVRFEAFRETGGNVQVSSYGRDNSRCNVVEWGGAPLTVTVACHTASGEPTLSSFVVWLEGQNGLSVGLKGAYLWANETTANSYTPHLAYQWNSRCAQHRAAHGRRVLHDGAAWARRGPERHGARDRVRRGPGALQGGLLGEAEQRPEGGR